MNKNIAKEIQAEQEHGRQKYSRSKRADDTAHDDSLPNAVWLACIAEHNNRAYSATPTERRQHLVKVAGLAISAVESFDRKRKPNPANGGMKG